MLVVVFVMESASFKVRGKDMLRLLISSTVAKEGTSRSPAALWLETPMNAITLNLERYSN